MRLLSALLVASALCESACAKSFESSSSGSDDASSQRDAIVVRAEDAGVDAARDSSTRSVPYCSTVDAQFCQAFDVGQYTDGFDQGSGYYGDGGYGLDTRIFESPTRSLLATTPSLLTVDGGAGENLFATFPPAGSGSLAIKDAYFSAAVWIESEDASAPSLMQADILGLHFTIAGVSDVEYQILLTDGGPMFGGYTATPDLSQPSHPYTYNSLQFGQALLRDQWVRLGIHVTLNPQGNMQGMFTVTVNGTPAATALPINVGGTLTGTMRIDLGISYSPPGSNARHVHYDDVSFAYQ
jgi:hypothetical protein